MVTLVDSVEAVRSKLASAELTRPEPESKAVKLSFLLLYQVVPPSKSPGVTEGAVLSIVRLRSVAALEFAATSVAVALSYAQPH